MGWQLHPAVVPLLIVTGVALTVVVAIVRWRRRRLVPLAHGMVCEHLSDAVIVLDDRERVADANRAARALAGRPGASRDGILGRPVAMVFPELWAAINTTGSEPQAPVEVALRVNGRMVEYEVRSAPFAQTDARAGRVVVACDVSLRKENERALVRAKEAAEAASRAKSTFLANMSHELRTPLTLIVGYGEMLLESLGTDDRQANRQQVQVVLQSADHLLKVINEILDLARIEAGRLDLTPREFDGDAFVEDVCHAAGCLARERGNAFHAEALSRLGPLYTDPVRLKQILLNLLGNACQYTQGGLVRLAYLRETNGTSGDWLTFRVDDTGAGIPADQLDRLFQPFSRAGSAPSVNPGGAGLGLAVSQRLAGLMGGTITVMSTPKVGSSFTVRIAASLPRSQRRVVA